MPRGPLERRQNQLDYATLDQGDSMKVGDTVIFTDEESRYFQWFYGKIGRVQYVSDYPLPSIRVLWTPPVRYFDNETRTAYSDFPANSFTILVKKP